MKGPQRLTLSETGSALTIGIPLARSLPPGGLFFGPARPGVARQRSGRLDACGHPVAPGSALQPSARIDCGPVGWSPSNGDVRGDGRVRVIALDGEILDSIFVDARRMAEQAHRRWGSRASFELGLGLRQMIEVDVNIAAYPDQVTDLQSGLLR